MPNQYDFYSQQYSGSSWYERILSGSNRVLVLGADGRISASSEIPSEVSIVSASYSVTSSYAEFANTLIGTTESASFAIFAESASHALSATFAIDSTFATTATTATSSTNLTGGYVIATDVSAATISSSGFLSGSSAMITGLSSVGQLVIFNPGSSPETGSAGITGEIRYDDDYIYLRTSAGLWKRSSLALY